MMLRKIFYSLFFVLCSLFFVASARAADFGVQNAWDNPDANMSAGSVKPGFAQLTWTPGTVLPIKLRNGMVTMVNLPVGEAIDDGTIGSTDMFQIDVQKGSRTLMITPATHNQGGDTNLIVTGKSGNVYLFYLRAEPANSSEITYSQVDIVLDPNSRLPAPAGTATTSGGGSNSIFPKAAAGSGTLGAGGEDYGWIKSMKIDPTQFRFDLDIYVPNPDDYVIAPERVWRDQIFTYIDFGDKVIAMTQRPVVSLLIEGGESPVGFRTDGDNGRLMIVEAVGDMVLRSGQRIVCIKKRAKPFLIADTQSVMALARADVQQSMLSNQSLNNAAYGGMGFAAGGTSILSSGGGSAGLTMPQQQMYGAPSAGFQLGGGATGNAGLNMIPSERTTAGSFLPQTNIPLITSNQRGVAVELKADTSVKALNDYWTTLLAKFSGDEGSGLLTPYKDMVFFAVDETGVGALGASATTARLYRLRVGPMPDIDTAQTLCDKLQKFQSMTCTVVRMQ